ncbi:hypothetical protein ACWDSJ_09235 [Nocardia sp. NPDC003482]
MADDQSDESLNSPDADPAALLGFKERILALVLGISGGVLGQSQLSCPTTKPAQPHYSSWQLRCC